MNVLVIGSGGREHAIAKKILEDEQVETVYCAKGNSGMIFDGIQLVDIEETNHTGLIEFARENQIDWTIVGPEIPLLNGIVDDFQAAGLKIFGPNKAAAMIEGSKEFAKVLMDRCGIPTATYQSFQDYDLALNYVHQKGTPIVIKADGLAAGKGVVVALSFEEAQAALVDMLQDDKFGVSGRKVVIEEFLAGEEFSLLAFVRDENVYPMVIAQDHKRAFDGDLGPNTGGMGAYSPVPQISEAIVNQAIQTVLIPAAKGMVTHGTPFTGILYAGLIATQDGPKVIEFNARFGDPETQVVLPRLNTSLAGIISAILDGQEPEIEWHEQASLGVVVAAKGYPEEYDKGVLIPENHSKDVASYFAGVAQEGEHLISAGGRVFLIQAQAPTLELAKEKVYHALNNMDVTEFFYRNDIGDKALLRK